jgi:hypothetical protein
MVFDLLAVCGLDIPNLPWIRRRHCREPPDLRWHRVGDLRFALPRGGSI